MGDGRSGGGGGGGGVSSGSSSLMASSSSSSSSSTSLLESFYWEKIQKGNMPTVSDLQAFCASKGLVCPSIAQLRKLRYRWKVTAVLSGWKGTRRFMSSSIMKPGVLMVDLAYYMKQFLVANAQMKYFLVGVDLLSGRLFCVPTINKKRSSWERAILEMVAANDGVSHIISDRDGAIVSLQFRKRIKRDYGINWSFLMSRGHAFRAERMISYLKRRLTQALKFNEKGDNCWTQHIPAILQEYNSRVIPGTTRTRDSINKHNYVEMLQELRGSEDPFMLFNVSSSTNYSPWLQQKLWNFAIGDRVLVTRESDYEAKGQQGKKAGSFFKRSIEGSFAPTVRRVTQMWIKDSRFLITPVYSVSGLTGKFYETDLIPALFAEKGQGGSGKGEGGGGFTALDRQSGVPDSAAAAAATAAAQDQEETSQENVADTRQSRTRSQRRLL